MTDFLQGYYVTAKPFLDFLADLTWGIFTWLVLMCFLSLLHSHFSKDKTRNGIVSVLLITPPTVILTVTYIYILVTIFWGLLLE